MDKTVSLKCYKPISNERKKFSNKFHKFIEDAQLQKKERAKTEANRTDSRTSNEPKNTSTERMRN